MPQKITIPAGTRFGRLTVLAESPERTPAKNVRWLCRCDCGAVRAVLSSNLRRGLSQSCGCAIIDATRKSNRTHGRSGRNPEYIAWCRMRQRCLNPKKDSFIHYGGRGITVCPEWESFERFYVDMGARPSPLHSIDRIDVDGPYSPENCRWATKTEQARNKRSNIRLSHNGRTMTLAEWAIETEVSYSSLYRRFKAGLPANQVLAPRIRHHREKNP